jgi:hypothetical protein
MEAKADQEFLPALSRTENAIELHVHRSANNCSRRAAGNRPADNTICRMISSRSCVGNLYFPTADPVNPVSPTRPEFPELQVQVQPHLFICPEFPKETFGPGAEKQHQLFPASDVAHCHTQSRDLPRIEFAQRPGTG